ncbi:MAG: PAS domain-containing protein [Pseudomonadota bacterium]
MKQYPRFLHPASLELYNYWNAQRGARTAPYRSEIEPADIRDVLSDIFILDVEGDGRYVWRLAGTRVCTVHCRELKGRNFISDWAGDNEEQMRSLLRTVVDKNLVAVVEIIGRNTRNQSIEMEMILMPLHVEGSNEKRVLGCLAPLDQPYWLGISPPVNREIVTTRVIWPSTPFGDPLPRRAAAIFGRAQPRQNEPASLLFMPHANMRRIRHLVVLDGGKKATATNNGGGPDFAA